MTRSEHLKFAKDRAMEYISRGDYNNAFASFISDLKEHPELADHSGITMGMMLKMGGNLEVRDALINFINGFN